MPSQNYRFMSVECFNWECLIQEKGYQMLPEVYLLHLINFTYSVLKFQKLPMYMLIFFTQKYGSFTGLGNMSDSQ